MKKCSKCKVNKAKDFFNKNISTSDRLQSECRECTKLAGRRKCPIQDRKHKLKYKYGITLEEYDEMFKDQGKGCKICLNEVKLYIDHCHVTSKVRGLLCQNCNLVLGHAKDSVTTLIKAKEYILESRL